MGLRGKFSNNQGHTLANLARKGKVPKLTNSIQQMPRLPLWLTKYKGTI